MRFFLQSLNSEDRDFPEHLLYVVPPASSFSNSASYTLLFLKLCDNFRSFLSFDSCNTCVILKSWLTFWRVVLALVIFPERPISVYLFIIIHIHLILSLSHCQAVYGHFCIKYLHMLNKKYLICM